MSRPGHETGWQIASLSSYALGGTLLPAQVPGGNPFWPAQVPAE